MAAKGGYTEVVDCLLDRDPHINATDQVKYCLLNIPQRLESPPVSRSSNLVVTVAHIALLKQKKMVAL